MLSWGRAQYGHIEHELVLTVKTPCFSHGLMKQRRLR